jgi:hypothetical protein
MVGDLAGVKCIGCVYMGWCVAATDISSTCNTGTQTRPGQTTVNNNRLLHVTDIHIIILEYLKRFIMTLNFVPPMAHINSLNNKILYDKSWDLCKLVVWSMQHITDCTNHKFSIFSVKILWQLDCWIYSQSRRMPHMPPYNTQKSKFSWGHAPNPLAFWKLIFLQINDHKFAHFFLKIL